MADKIVIASDHGGLATKSALVTSLKSRGVDVVDLGTMTDESVDYPDFAALVASAVSKGDADRGILVCGTGIGISIAANKFPWRRQTRRTLRRWDTDSCRRQSQYHAYGRKNNPTAGADRPGT